MAVLPDFDMLLFRRHRRFGDAQTTSRLVSPVRRGARCPPHRAIFGVARTALSQTEYVIQAEAACREFLLEEFDATQWQAFSALLYYVKLDAGVEKDYAALTSLLKDRADRDPGVFLLHRVQPVFGDLPKPRQGSGVVTPLSRVVLEKPLGHDTASADLINEQVGAGVLGGGKFIASTTIWVKRPFRT